MILLSVLCGAMALVLLLPTLSDIVSIVRVAARKRAPAAVAPGQPRFLFLVPAHNEELLLTACLDSLRRLRYPAKLVDIVVLADNCSDRTVEIARAAGVRCLERTDPLNPGKSRAIAWALSQLSLTNSDAMVIVDADTELDVDFAARLATAAPLADKVLQPYNGVSNETDNALTRMAAVLSAANHGVAYVFKTRAGLTVPLSAGMCIGSRVLAAYGWTVHSLSEDWELYALLTARGVRIEEIPGARIRAQEAATLRASGTQRRRWTAGKLAVLRKHAWPLLRSRAIGMAQKLDVLGELSAPGPALHLCVVAVAVAAIVLLRPPAFQLLSVLLAASLLRPVLYTLIALTKDREPLRALAAFTILPFYAVWRLWVAVSTIGTVRSRIWVRTARHRSVSAR